MLRLFNTLGKKTETFHPVNKKVVRIFTCGPSVYQRAHIGNFRTYLFEDILVRYLEYSGFKVQRGMNFTDIEDKALKDRFLPRISKEKALVCFCLTEPETGSDAAAIRTKALLKEDHYLINGRKCFITNGGVADLYSVFALTNPAKKMEGITGFLIEKGNSRIEHDGSNTGRRPGSGQPADR